MKKVIIFTLAVVLSVSAFAEGKFGLMGGFTSSSLKIKELDLKKTAGFHAGITYHLPVALGFSVQPSLLYNVKGETVKAAIANIKSTLGYLELPVQLQYGIDLIIAKPYLFVEPFVGCALNGMVGDEKFDLSNLKTRLEYGLGVGAGIMALSHLQLSLKYFWNFEDCNINSYLGTVAGSFKERSSFDGLIVSAAFLF